MVPNGRPLIRPTLRPTPTHLLIAFFIAFALVAITSGCAGEQPSNVPPDASPEPVTAARDGLLVTLSVDRSTLPAADRTWVSVSVENTSSEVRLWRGGGCNPLADITIRTATAVTPEPGRSWDGLAGTFKELLAQANEASDTGWFLDERFVDQAAVVACPANLGVNQISAGQRLEMRAAWDGEIQSVAAPPGPARITASFPYLGAAGKPDAPQPIEATVKVDVANPGIRLLSGSQAIDAALGDADFASWLASANMNAWSGVDLQSQGKSYVVILSLDHLGGTTDGRATVDRETGAVSFDTRARQ
jgi:hypothetical protein